MVGSQEIVTLMAEIIAVAEVMAEMTTEMLAEVLAEVLASETRTEMGVLPKPCNASSFARLYRS